MRSATAVLCSVWAAALCAAAAVPSPAPLRRLSDSIGERTRFLPAAPRIVSLSRPSFPALTFSPQRIGRADLPSVVSRPVALSSQSAPVAPSLAVRFSSSPVPAFRTTSFALRPAPFPPATRPPLDRSRVFLLTGGLSPSQSSQLVAKLAYEAMQEDAENPTDPKWRPYLAELIANPLPDVDSDQAYQLLLAGFEGVDDAARMCLAEAWAARHDGGRYAGAVAYASLRAIFNAGDYADVHRRAEAVAAAHPAFAVRAYLLSVLADGYLYENGRAKATLARLKTETAGTPDEPEVLYMEAWFALETFREGEAKSILHRILRDHPASAAARKAREILDALSQP